MEENNNRLEEYFRRQFNQPQNNIPQSEWNTPPTNAWDNIKLALNKKDKKDRKQIIFWRYLSLLLGLILISFLGHYYSFEKIKNKRLVQELETSNQIIADLIRQPDTLVSDKVTVNEEERIINKYEDIDVHQHNQEKDERISLVTDQRVSSSSAEYGESAISESPHNYAENHHQKQFNHILSNTPRNDLIMSSSINPVVDTKNHINLTEGIGVKAVDKIAINEMEIQTIRNQYPTIALSKNEHKRPKFFIGLEGGTRYKIQEKPSLPPRPGVPDNSLVFENHFNAQNFGFKAGYNISKNWSIESGLSYTKSDININHERFLALSNLNEIKDRNGNYIGLLNFEIPTSYGGISTNVVSSRSSATSLDPDDIINVGADIDNSIHQLFLPLVLRYTKAWGPIMASARIGVVNSWVTNNEVVINRLNASNNDLLFMNATNQVGNRSDQNKYQLNYLAGLGLDYNFSDGCSLYFEPSYSQSASPLVNQGRFKAFNKQLSINVGIKKLL